MKKLIDIINILQSQQINQSNFELFLSLYLT